MKRFIYGALVCAACLTACNDPSHRTRWWLTRVQNTLFRSSNSLAAGTTFGEMQLLAPLPIGANDSVQGVSAPFAGMVNGRLVVAGGCNFPGKPAAAGGAKVYYADIYCYDAKHDRWDKVGELPQPLAYGASVTRNGCLYLLGGNNADGASASVYELMVRSSGWRDLFGLAPALELRELPSLPEPMDNFAATCFGDWLFVAGGNQSGRPGNRAYGYNLWQHADQWTALPDFPGPTRVQPVLTTVSGTIGHAHFDALCLMGGFQAGQPVAGSEVPSAAVASDEMLLYAWPAPADSTEPGTAADALPAQGAWEVLGTLPSRDLDVAAEALADGSIAAAGAFAVNLNAESFIVGGGVDKRVFIRALDNTRLTLEARAAGSDSLLRVLEAEKADYLTHPAAWYHFNDAPYYFLAGTAWRWIPMGDLPQTARAGAAAVYDCGYLYLIGGELKPGIRTAEVSRTWIGLEQAPATFMGSIIEVQGAVSNRAF